MIKFQLVTLNLNYKTILTNNPKWAETYKDFLGERDFILLGEVQQMPGHVVVAGHSGRVYYGYHLEDFDIVPDEEA